MAGEISRRKGNGEMARYRVGGQGEEHRGEGWRQQIGRCAGLEAPRLNLGLQFLHLPG